MSYKEKLIEKELTKNYEKYYRLAYSYVQNEADALDVVQEGAYKAVKNAEKVKSEEFVSTWIYRIMINEACSLIRERKKIVPMFDDYEEGVPDDYEDLDLANAIETLDERDRTIVKLKYFEGLSLKEIAEITELNENTVKTRLYRTLDKLKDILEVKDNGKEIKRG